MSADRFVVLGLAQVRSRWFSEVGRWATASSIPVEFVKTVSMEEVRVRLGSGRPFSALLVDDGLPGVDRDLAEVARAAGCALVVVRTNGIERDWAALGAAATLPADFARAELVEVLAATARPIARVEAVPEGPVVPDAARQSPSTWRGRLVAVTGAPGVGRSTLSMALAHGLAADPRRQGLVCLADLALDADQGMLHDAHDVVPGLLELVDAHRLGVPTATEVTATTWAVDGRGYRLLLGLRRHRDWTALRPHALGAALESLRRAFRCVVAEVDADVEGEAECGSTDVEDRNLLARSTLATADVVVVVGTATLTGVHHAVRVLRDVRGVGVDPERIVTVVNRAPRSPRARAEVTGALADLVGRELGLASPAFVPERRRLDDAFRVGAPPPAPVVRAVTTSVDHLLDASAARPARHAEPARVAPGSLGTWTGTEDTPP